jgi:hypothetical protein
MANTNFINQSTVVVADWLNDVNDVVYDVLGNGTVVPTTKTALKTNLALQNVDNTSDANKPVSTATQTALNGKATITGTTGAVEVPVGNTAQRPAGVTGLFRFNSQLVRFEGFNGSVWGAVGGGATGGGNDQVFFENDTVVTTNHTINRNSHSVGPISVNSGVTLTIASGRRLVIL